VWDVNIERQQGDDYHEYLNFEIGRILHFKSEIRDFELDLGRQRLAVRFKISDLK
jgi:hypothetical protein